MPHARDRPVPRAIDTPKVAARNRVYLPACLTELDWSAHAELRLRVEDGQGGC